MAFSILFIVGAVIWLLYEYLTDDAYHYRQSEKRKIKTEHRKYDAECKALLDDGWTVLESYAYETREREIESGLHKENPETLQRIGVNNPPVGSTIPYTYKNGMPFYNSYFFIKIAAIEFSLINYNEKVISKTDMIKGKFPNHERDVRFYNWFKYIYDLYMMDHISFIMQVGRVPSKRELVYRKGIIEKTVGNLYDHEYGESPEPNRYCYSERERGPDGNWYINPSHISAPFYYGGEESFQELCDFLSRKNKYYENDITEKDISQFYEEALEYGSYPILVHDKEILRGNIKPSFVEADVVELLLPDFTNGDCVVRIPPIQSESNLSPDWNVYFYADTFDRAVSIIENEAASYWEIDEKTGEYVLHAKAYVIFGQYKKIDTSETITKKLYIEAKSAEGY